jgi:hypothetical protein
VKASVFEKPGLEFLKLIDVEEPKITVCVNTSDNNNKIDHSGLFAGVEVRFYPHSWT